MSPALRFPNFFSGGNDGVNYKPNHLSVMNYAFQVGGLLRDGQPVVSAQRRWQQLQQRQGEGPVAALIKR